MSEQSKDTTEKSIENVEIALSKAELFIEKNQKILTIVAASILGIVALFFGLKRFYFTPLENEANAQLFHAERYFEADSFNLALNGDGNNIGFLQATEDYSFTKAGNLACYYSGICYLHLGEFENAIEYLKKFNSSDTYISTIALGAIGDAYSETGDIENGIKYYKKASKRNTNAFVTPVYLMKLAQLIEKQNKYEEAINIYNKIKIEFPKSQEAAQIDKYITRAELLNKK